jgi:hypothetical protein
VLLCCNRGHLQRHAYMCSLGHTTVALLTSFKQVDLCWMLILAVVAQIR